MIFNDIRSNKEINLIFIDLDLTLFDYTFSREQGAKAALKTLGTNENFDYLFRTYLSILKHWKGFKLLGFPDIRRYWNDPSIYLLSYIFTSPGFQPQTANLFDLITKIEDASDDLRALEQILNINSHVIGLLQNIYKDTSENKAIQSQIEHARSQFDDVTSKLEPFNGARKLLTEIKQAGYHCFILTEGDHKIQSDKIWKLGLNDIISKEEVIITDELSAANNIITRIERLKNEYTRQLELGAREIDALKTQIDSIEFIKGLFPLFERKKNKHFHGHAIHIAIKYLLGQSSNNDFPNVSPEEWSTLPSIKLATLGDRYINDIKPLVDIFGNNNILSIHMLYGKYKHETPSANESVRTDFSVQNLNTALKIILDPENWVKKSPIFRPRHFFLSDHNLIWNSAIGLTIPAPISSISESIMQDLGFHQDQIESLKEKILTEFVNITAKTKLIERLKQIIPRIKTQ